MPRFEVVGIGRETGRKRKKIYTTANKESAIIAAAADGTIVEVDKIRQLPEPLATENQIKYAKAYNIKNPETLTKEQMSILLTKAEDENWPKGTTEPATEKQMRLAGELGLDIPNGLSEFVVSNLINEALKKWKYKRRFLKLPPTENQLELLKCNEVVPPPGATRIQVSKIIDSLIANNLKENI